MEAVGRQAASGADSRSSRKPWSTTWVKTSSRDLSATGRACCMKSGAWQLAFGMEIQRVLWQLDDFLADVDSPEEPEEGRPRRRAQPAAGGSTVQLAAVPDNSVDLQQLTVQG